MPKLLNSDSVRSIPQALRQSLMALLVAAPLTAQQMTDCSTVFVGPMPESLDAFITTELVRSGVMLVVKDQDKAKCLISFGRQQDEIEVTASGPSGDGKATVTRERATERLPDSIGLFSKPKLAAIQLIHRESTAVVWASSKSDPDRSVQRLARKLVGQLQKDLNAAFKRSK
jgi:hypothetical protein